MILTEYREEEDDEKEVREESFDFLLDNGRLGRGGIL